MFIAQVRRQSSSSCGRSSFWKARLLAVILPIENLTDTFECSPERLATAQVIGSVMGCVIAPATFLLFYKAFPVGVPGTAYPAPYATIYRAMAVLGVEVRLPIFLPCSI